MKTKRQIALLELIESFDISTQDRLQELLEEGGFRVTQATISRDIKQLGIIKSLDKSGNYSYTTLDSLPDTSSDDGIFKAFKNSVLKTDIAVNIVVIKTTAGMANALCAGIDEINSDEIIGTIAGDDTIFVLLKNKKSAENYLKKIQTNFV